MSEDIFNAMIWLLVLNLFLLILYVYIHVCVMIWLLGPTGGGGNLMVYTYGPMVVRIYSQRRDIGRFSNAT